MSLVGTHDDIDVAAAERFEFLVGEREAQLEIDELARARLAVRHAARVPQPSAIGLAAFLAQHDPDPTWAIDGALPTGGNAMLVAQYKAGKSTLVGNLVRSLADGDPFLGAHDVRPGPLVLIDNELDERTLRRWLRDQLVQRPENVRLVALRGRVSSFDILDPTVRSAWAAELRGARTLILDCLRPALDGLGLSEDKDAGKFLTAFDALKYEAGVSESTVVHHMGHNGERSRGDSRILDWPDVTWKVVREKQDDPTSRRYFSAFGRDVEIGESGLEFDPGTRHLSLAGGSRQQARAGEHVGSVVEVLRANDGGMTQNRLVAALHDAGVPRDAARDAPKEAVRRGVVRLDHGPNRTNVFTLLGVVGGGERK